MISSHKNFINLNIAILVILVFFPKIDIIPIPGQWQGIRIEDILLLAFILQYLLNTKKNFWKEDYQYKYIVIFFTYYFFSNFKVFG